MLHRLTERAAERFMRRMGIDPMPNARAYDDPIVFALDYDEWRRRNGILPARMVINDVESSPHQAHRFGKDDGPTTGRTC